MRAVSFTLATRATCSALPASKTKRVTAGSAPRQKAGRLSQRFPTRQSRAVTATARSIKPCKQRRNAANFEVLLLDDLSRPRTRFGRARTHYPPTRIQEFAHHCDQRWLAPESKARKMHRGFKGLMNVKSSWMICVTRPGLAVSPANISSATGRAADPAGIV